MVLARIYTLFCQIVSLDGLSGLQTIVHLGTNTYIILPFDKSSIFTTFLDSNDIAVLLLMQYIAPFLHHDHLLQTISLCIELQKSQIGRN